MTVTRAEGDAAYGQLTHVTVENVGAGRGGRPVRERLGLDIAAEQRCIVVVANDAGIVLECGFMAVPGVSGRTERSRPASAVVSIRSNANRREPVS